MIPIHHRYLPPSSTSYLRTKISLPSVGDAEQRQAGRHIADRVAVAHRQAHDVRRHQQFAARVDVEGAAVDAVGIDMLDRVGLAGRRIDRETARCSRRRAKTGRPWTSIVEEARFTT